MATRKTCDICHGECNGERVRFKAHRLVFSPLDVCERWTPFRPNRRELDVCVGCIQRIGDEAKKARSRCQVCDQPLTPKNPQ